MRGGGERSSDIQPGGGKHVGFGDRVVTLVQELLGCLTEHLSLVPLDQLLESGQLFCESGNSGIGLVQVFCKGGDGLPGIGKFGQCCFPISQSLAWCHDRHTWCPPAVCKSGPVEAIIIDDAVILTMVFYCMKAVVLSSRNMT